MQNSYVKHEEFISISQKITTNKFNTTKKSKENHNKHKSMLNCHKRPKWNTNTCETTTKARKITEICKKNHSQAKHCKREGQSSKNKHKETNNNLKMNLK